MKKVFIVLLASLFFLHTGFAQPHCTKENRELCEMMLGKFAASQMTEFSIDRIAVIVGRTMLGTPYVAKTLEIEGDEKLVVDLGGLDCTTFLENVVVFSRLAKKEDLRFEAFLAELETLRYRDGKQGDYPTRLHYFSDWIYENAQKGIIRDITQEIGGISYPNQLDFMSTHRSAYAQLSSDDFHQAIQKTETDINKRTYHYIPKAKVANHEANIQSGDLIAITTGIKGLDIAHVGIAYEQNERIHLMHASTGSKQVVISDKPLADYLAGNKSQSGIMVCRLEAPE